MAALPDRVPAGLLARPLTRTPLVLIQAGPAPAGTWAPADGEPFVFPRHGLVRTAADQWFRGLGVVPHVAAEADGHEALPTLVSLGYGTGVIPRLVLRHSSVRSGLREVPVASGPGELSIGVCVRRADLRRPPVAAAWAGAGRLGA